jgi:hypothetical protein
MNRQILKGSDDGVYYSKLLDCFNFSIVRYSRNYKTLRFGNWNCFHRQMWGRRHLLCWVPQKELTSITGPQQSKYLALPLGRKQIQFPKRNVL